MVCFHTKPIRVLHPVVSVWRIDGCCIACDVVELHVRPIHDVQRPQRRIFDSKVLHEDLRYIPEDERHWSSRLRNILLDIIPGISVTIDSPCTVSLNGDVISSNDETSMVVLECNWIRIIAPIIEIVRELDLTSVSLISRDYVLLLLRGLLVVYSRGLYIPSTRPAIQSRRCLIEG